MWPLFIGVIFYAYTANVRATIHEELKGYVTKAEFHAWVEAHKQWSEEVLKRIDGNLTDMKEVGRQNNEMLKEIMSRPPRPLRPSDQK